MKISLHNLIKFIANVIYFLLFNILLMPVNLFLLQREQLTFPNLKASIPFIVAYIASAPIINILVEKLFNHLQPRLVGTTHLHLIEAMQPLQPYIAARNLLRLDMDIHREQMDSILNNRAQQRMHPPQRMHPLQRMHPPQIQNPNLNIQFNLNIQSTGLLELNSTTDPISFYTVYYPALTEFYRLTNDNGPVGLFFAFNTSLQERYANISPYTASRVVMVTNNTGSVMAIALGDQQWYISALSPIKILKEQIKAYMSYLKPFMTPQVIDVDLSADEASIRHRQCVKFALEQLPLWGRLELSKTMSSCEFEVLPLDNLDRPLPMYQKLRKGQLMDRDATLSHCMEVAISLTAARFRTEI